MSEGRDKALGRLIALVLAVVVGLLVWTGTRNIGIGGIVLCVIVVVVGFWDARR